jgi:hypothetical protein
MLAMHLLYRSDPVQATMLVYGVRLQFVCRRVNRQVLPGHCGPRRRVYADGIEGLNELSGRVHSHSLAICLVVGIHQPPLHRACQRLLKPLALPHKQQASVDTDTRPSASALVQRSR